MLRGVPSRYTLHSAVPSTTRTKVKLTHAQRCGCRRLVLSTLNNHRFNQTIELLTSHIVKLLNESTYELRELYDVHFTVNHFFLYFGRKFSLNSPDGLGPL